MSSYVSKDKDIARGIADINIHNDDDAPSVGRNLKYMEQLVCAPTFSSSPRSSGRRSQRPDRGPQFNFNCTRWSLWRLCGQPEMSTPQSPTRLRCLYIDETASWRGRPWQADVAVTQLRRPDFLQRLSCALESITKPFDDFPLCFDLQGYLRRLTTSSATNRKS